METQPSASGVVLVMGVSGSGKSTIARLLAERLDGIYLDADDFHPTVNVEAMRAGRPLNDAMRYPWLEVVAERVNAVRTGAGEQDGPVVVACSALKRAYRDFLRQRIGPFRVVYLDGTAALISTRHAARRGHFMPLSLLESQFADLEPPSADEDTVALSIADAPEIIVCRAARWLENDVKGSA